MSSMKPFLFLGMMLCSMITSAGDDSWKCQWFGWGCDEGAQNQTLIDFGRQRTVESFLFFDSDSAHIEQIIEFSFSARSAAMGDYVDLQWEGEVPAGTSVSLNGKNVLSPNWHRIEAQNQPWQGVLAISIPPSGNDHEISGGLKVKPQGFERAGSQDLTSQSSKPLTMVRVQGEVDSDWHWFKRLIFWFTVFSLTSLCLIKFFFAPVFFHPRLKVNKVKVVCFPAQGPFVNGITPAIETYKWKGHREIWLVGDRKGKRDKQSLWRDFLYGRTGYEIRDYLGNTEFRIRRTRSRKGRGMRLEVMQFSNGKKRPSSVYSKYEPAQNRVSFNADNEPRILQFDFE